MHLHACPFFLMGLVLAVLTQPVLAQSDMALVSYVGPWSENERQWNEPHRGMDLEKMQKALRHLHAHAETVPLPHGTDISSDPWGRFETDFDLIEALLPGFATSTIPVGAYQRLSHPHPLHHNGIYQEHPVRPWKASFSGFKFMETWRYTSEGSFIKQVRRVFPMESFVSRAASGDESLLISAMGVCDCGRRPSPKVRPSSVSFQHDMVVDVPFEDRPDAPTNMAALNMVRLLLSDVGSGKLTVLDYDPPSGIVPAAQERVHTHVKVHVYNEFGEIVGSRDTVFVTTQIGDEFGKKLGTTQLNDKLHFHHMVKVYDDWGEVIGTEPLKHPISSRDIRGFRFYETWYFLEKNPCPVKKVEYVVPLVGKWDVDGNFAGLTPLSFAIGIP